MLDAPPLTETNVERYLEIRRFGESLCEPLQTEDFVIQSMPDASPTKWHLAHTTWFFETFVLIAAMPGYRAFHPRFEYLFNSYYDAVGDRHPRNRRGLLSRPSVEEVFEYRHYVDRHMQELCEAPPTAELSQIIELGLHHEQQHQELMLTDIKHAFWCNPLQPVYSAHNRGSSTPAPVLTWRTYPEGVHQIGSDSEGFCYDNELPRHSVFVQGFRFGSRLVTNGEYLNFMEEGGYERPEFWLSDGWDAVQDEKWRAPSYWVRNGQWCLLTLSGMRAIDPNEPVCHVSYYEADAYARWIGARLPTEAEWETVAQQELLEGNFVESGLFHPTAMAGTESAASNALRQLFGDVWEWTSSPYTAYPGFRPTAGALGEYNGKFMCNQLVLRGGSCVTSQSHIRTSYRNFFYPDRRWQFTGIRLASDV